MPSGIDGNASLGNTLSCLFIKSSRKRPLWPSECMSGLSQVVANDPLSLAGFCIVLRPAGSKRTEKLHKDNIEGHILPPQLLNNVNGERMLIYLTFVSIRTQLNLTPIKD